ncbi:hypothetical protein emb_1d0660 [Coriobacteriaceae bacterium EMTCatB1]|nr:hypothetical protein emb_1d0660 [Coriobacteriaceae bacterium EMTCatB1]
MAHETQRIECRQDRAIGACLGLRIRRLQHKRDAVDRAVRPGDRDGSDRSDRLLPALQALWDRYLQDGEELRIAAFERRLPWHAAR